jgi:hypothetical protein
LDVGQRLDGLVLDHEVRETLVGAHLDFFAGGEHDLADKVDGGGLEEGE